MIIKRDLQLVGLTIKFIRLKRRLNQDEVADEAGINRAIVSLVETGNIGKAGLRSVYQISSALRINQSSFEDPSLYQLLRNEETNVVRTILESEYPDWVDNVMKIYSAVFDAYCSLLPWTVNLAIAKKSRRYDMLINSPGVKEAIELRTKIWEEAMRSGKPVVKIDILDYLPSYFILDLLSSMSREDLLYIFSLDEKMFISDVTIFENALSQDPFKKFMEKIGVRYMDYFGIIDLIVSAAEELRKTSFSNFPESVEYVVRTITKIVGDASI